MRPRSYLHELSEREKRRFYSEEFFEGHTREKIKTFVIAIVIIVGDLIINSLPPSPFRARNLTLMIANFMTPVAFIIYAFSYSGCLHRKGHKFLKIRIALNCLGLLIFASSCVVVNYIRTKNALKFNQMDSWVIVHLQLILSIHILPLISQLTPIWYMKVLVGGSYYLGTAIGYAEYNYRLKNWIIGRNTLSFVFLIALTYLSFSFKYKQFVLRMEAESWNEVYKDVVENSSGCVAIINIDGKITYSNPEFQRITEGTSEIFFEKLSKIKIRSWSGIPGMSTDRTQHTKEGETQINIEEEIIPIGKYSSNNGCASEYANLNQLIEHYKVLLSTNKLGIKDRVAFDGKIDRQVAVRDVSLYEGTIRPLIEHKKLILMFSDITERGRITILENTNDYKDKLLASISHELKTPLNGNLGYLQAGVNNKTVPDIVKYKFLLPALRSGQLLSHLINDILDYSQIQTEKMKLFYDTKPLRETLEYCYNLFEHAFSAKSLTFDLVVDRFLPAMFKTDHERLTQIILNLLSNALKFTMEGGVKFECECIDNHNARITIKDTGIGIKRHNISKLFQDNVLNNSDEELQKHSKGVGLGLKIAYKISKLIGVDDTSGIQVHSISKYGSTFSFTVKNLLSLPFPAIHKDNIIEIPDDDDDKESDTTPGANLSSISIKEIPTEHTKEEDELHLGRRLMSSYSQATKVLPFSRYNSHQRLPRPISKTTKDASVILVVDDDPFNVLVLESLVAQFNITVESANNGEQAVEKVLSNPKLYRLIFMDCQMPIMDGFEATQILTLKMQTGDLQSIPIVGCTTFNAKNKIEECLKCGMKEVINKPVMVDKLRMLIDKYLDDPT